MTSSSMTVIARLAQVPRIDGLDYVLVEPKAALEVREGDVYVAGIDEEGDMRVCAFVDGTTGATYPCDRIESDEGLNPRDRGAEPLVRLVGAMDEATGQVVIKQPEGHWRRYSRWDRMEKAPPTQPEAVVRTLPQCGCGGYLGAPMMFDSFPEMLAYFFVVFSDAESVNAKHAAILTGDGCCVVPREEA